MNTPLRILVMLATTRLSGPARQILQIFEHADPAEFRLTLASPWIPGMPRPDFFNEAQRRGIPVRVLQQNRRYDPRLITQAEEIVREEGIDLVQSHGYKPSMIALGLKMRSGLPWIAFMHGETNENLRIRLYNLLDFNVVRFADRVVTVSDEMRRRYIRRGLSSEKLRTLHNAVDQATFVHTTSPQLLRERFKIPPGARVAGVIGRFSPEKGHLHFLKAFELIAPQHPELVALLVGEGQEEQELRRWCRDRGLESRVIFTGFQANVADVYPLLDLVVMPSLSEGLPNVALEALCHSLPVVATAVGGTPEVVLDGRVGLLVPPGNPAALAGAMNRILNDSELAQVFSAAGPKLIQERFTPAIKIERLAEIYREVHGISLQGKGLTYG